MGNKTSINELSDEIAALREEIKDLKKQEHNNIKTISLECAEYRNKSEEYFQDIESNKEKISEYLNIFQPKLEDIANVDNHIREINKSNEELKNKINDFESIIDEYKVIHNNIDSIKATYSSIEETANNIEETEAEVNDTKNQIQAIFKNITTTKDDFDILTYEIFGKKDDEENIQEGLKDKLQKSFNSISNDMNKLKADFDKLKTEQQNSFKESIENNNSEFNAFIENNQKIYEGIEKQIRDLLPKSLTVGLSSEYSKKKRYEIHESKVLAKRFIQSILGLVVISIIPFFVSAYLLYSGDLKTTIEYLPKMIFSMLPLYAPVVWAAYYLNKKLNLSKRLIEEYTHKEVLSRTFEGLSTQISTLPDNELTVELKTKLLYTLLSANSENPGKLISNYDTSDHPLMDALDKSAKLSDAIEALSRIPGMNKLSNFLEKKADKILEEQENKIDNGLDTINNKNETQGK